MPSVIVWFRRDLRLEDNPAIEAALHLKLPIIPVFIWAPNEEKPWSSGAASSWWIQKSLESFSNTLKSRKSQLIVRYGKSLLVLQDLVRETDAKFVFWNRLYEPSLVRRDQEIKASLAKRGVEAKSFNGSLLFEPWAVQTKSKTPFQVFTPFSRACAELTADAPTPAPAQLLSPKTWPPSKSLEGIVDSAPWQSKLTKYWTPGEPGASRRCDEFLKGPTILNYKVDRDFPSLQGTSLLSPHLHFGEVSPRKIWAQLIRKKKTEWYQRELLWREFAHHVLFYFPSTPNEPLRTSFLHFPWIKNKSALSAWKLGKTGYPIVDAGMRELWETGWMHNRVRMIVASFLTKHLLINWLEGARWFWDTLVDADLANNTLGWQWAGGCGADAAPYFRIFNPVLQGQKFDAEGAYVRKWIPELSTVSNKFIHCPWESNERLNYPAPIVNHSEARARALKAFSASRK